ncbi:protein vein isoform X2 [Contarinia nasturtii]|uniref:protein vein isoform X2 n=1 Tax=Contarinia nasturtii TaxID=265458 RepID=UPI0012D45449|nr:protein vein isoform X2 [Contarinia nasturtii]
MNAHDLRKRSLAKNLIFILLPVLILLVSWCQCSSSTAPSSSVHSNSKMFSDLRGSHRENYQHDNTVVGGSSTQQHQIKINNLTDFSNVPKHENSQKYIYNIHNSNEKRTQRMNEIRTSSSNDEKENHQMATNLFNYNNGHNKDIYNSKMIDRKDERPSSSVTASSSSSSSDFVTYGLLLRKLNVNDTQKRWSLQQRIKRTKHDLVRKTLHHYQQQQEENQQQPHSRVLPKTTNKYNNDSIRSSNYNNHRSNIFYNWINEHHHNNNNNTSNKHEIIAIEIRNASNHHHTSHNHHLRELSRKNTSKLIDASLAYMNSKRIFSDMVNESGAEQSPQKVERNRRESRSELKTTSNTAIGRLSPFSNSRINGLPFGNANSPRPRRFCSARDPTTLAFEAPTVFTGKVRSMSSDRRRNFSVTFEVKEIYKRQIGLKLPSLIRLKFTYKNSSECDIYRETFRSIGHVRDELEPGKLYILFVNQIDLGNFTILGQPFKRTRKNDKDVRTGVAEKYGQRAYIESLMANNATIREGKRLRIVCKVRGHPPPKVTWFKDDRSIAKNRSRYQFVHLRRRSELIIKSAFVNDSGLYECRAKNKLARQPIRKFTRIDVLPKTQEYTRNNNWNHSGSTCPVIGNAFCLNGGTCVFFKDVGEPACKCPDGFLGNRCETKNPTNIHSNSTLASLFLEDEQIAVNINHRSQKHHHHKKYP